MSFIPIPSGAQQIRIRRMVKGITQASLAKSVGVSTAHIKNLEHGRSLPNVILTQRIADKLDCTIDELWPTPEAA